MTIVELLVVVALIALLIGLLLPAIMAAREAARAAQCKSKLRQLTLAALEYEGARRHFPVGRFRAPDPEDDEDDDANPQLEGGADPQSNAWSWIAECLPFLEEGALYNTGGVPSATLAESGIADRQIDALLCPSDAYAAGGPLADRGNLDGFPVGLTSYQAVSGSNWGADGTQGVDDIGTDWRSAGANGSFDG